MRTIAIALLLIAPAAHAACDWNKPGQARYRGRVDAAINGYTDLAPDVRRQLIAQASRPREADIAVITRDTIASQAWKYTALRDMHWGKGLCRGAVDRSRWTDVMSERALVYCVGDACVAVPTVCGNVARVTRTGRTAAGVTAQADPPLGPLQAEPLPLAPMVLAVPTDPDGDPPFLFDAPGAGAEPIPVAERFRPAYFAPVWAPGYAVGLVAIPAPIPVVPEPSVLAMLAAGLAAIGFLARRR